MGQSDTPTFPAALIAAFEHFYRLDYANAAIHLADVRFSPITFGLAEVLAPLRGERFDVAEVLDDWGAYPLDTGR